MVFGFATSDEIKRIESNATNQKLCKGHDLLSSIQLHYHGRNSNISGIVAFKDIYYPYSFGCSNEYSFNSTIKLLPEDYRISKFQTWTLVFITVLGSISLIYLVTLCFKYRKIMIVELNILVFIFMLLGIIQLIIAYFSTKIKIYDEFVYDSKNKYIYIILFQIVLVLMYLIIFFFKYPESMKGRTIVLLIHIFLFIFSYCIQNSKLYGMSIGAFFASSINCNCEFECQLHGLSLFTFLYLILLFISLISWEKSNNFDFQLVNWIIGMYFTYFIILILTYLSLLIELFACSETVDEKFEETPLLQTQSSSINNINS